MAGYNFKEFSCWMYRRCTLAGMQEMALPSGLCMSVRCRETPMSQSMISLGY